MVSHLVYSQRRECARRQSPAYRFINNGGEIRIREGKNARHSGIVELAEYDERDGRKKERREERTTHSHPESNPGLATLIRRMALAQAWGVPQPYTTGAPDGVSAKQEEGAVACRGGQRRRGACVSSQMRGTPPELLRDMRHAGSRRETPEASAGWSVRSARTVGDACGQNGRKKEEVRVKDAVGEQSK
ncbi:hypothetical protein FB451DRAFT_1163817 [Mycena latifolia]|nr:hypothetical protein FB451DRAFT_1163817 [Mycena latifolia]